MPNINWSFVIIVIQESCYLDKTKQGAIPTHGQNRA